MEKGIQMIYSLLPPSDDDGHVRKWRMAVATSLITAIAVGVMFFTYAIGGFAAFGAEGFARAHETPNKAEVDQLTSKVGDVELKARDIELKVRDIEQQVRDTGRKVDLMEQRDLRRALLDAQREVCASIETVNVRQQDYWLEERGRIVDATGMTYPECEEMGF